MAVHVKAFATFFLLAVCALPFLVQADPFGGQIQQLRACYNAAIYTYLSDPRGGPYIWTPSTKTYPFGPPTHTGQWLLGLGGIPTFCVISPFPLEIWTGTYMEILGSSQ